AESRKQRKVNNMRGQLEFSEVGSAQYYELRAAIMAVYQQPLSDFMEATPSAATTPSPEAGSSTPATSTSAARM
ncbi:unnamed protein product, partial [Pylaiella littoralis]